MEHQGDPTVILAAFIATIWLLACFGLLWLSFRAEKQTGAAPWWGYAALGLFLASCAGLLVTSGTSLFASYVYMTGGGIIGGACTAYYGLRAILTARAWWTRRT